METNSHSTCFIQTKSSFSYDDDNITHEINLDGVVNTRIDCEKEDFSILFTKGINLGCSVTFHAFVIQFTFDDTFRRLSLHSRALKNFSKNIVRLIWLPLIVIHANT